MVEHELVFPVSNCLTTSRNETFRFSSDVTCAFAAAFAIVLARSIVRYVREGSVRLVFAAIAALLWSSPLLNPWYVQWLLPAAATAGRWARYAWWFGLLVMARYVEDALRYPTTPAALSQRILLLGFVTIAILAAPIIAAMLEEGPLRRVRSSDD